MGDNDGCLAAAIGAYLGYKVGEAHPIATCCCFSLAGLAIWSIINEKLTQNVNEQQNIIGSDRKIVQTFQKTSPSLENVIDPDIQKSKSTSFLLNQIRNYQENIGPRIKEELQVERLCRYTPSCSEYAKQAIEKYGPYRGLWIATGRLLRCNPLSKGGDDLIT